MSEWISVKDKLPPRGEDVLVYWHRRCIVCYMASAKNGGHTWYDVAEQSWINEPEAVTHWMFLPAPPKETGPDCKHYRPPIPGSGWAPGCAIQAQGYCLYGDDNCEYEPAHCIGDRPSMEYVRRIETRLLALERHVFDHIGWEKR